MNEDILYIWLSFIHGVGSVIGSKLINEFKEIISLYNASYEELIAVDGVGKKIANTIINSRDLSYAQKIYNYCVDEKIHILKKYNKDYPFQLNKYNESPIVLYAKGILKDSSPSIAMIGSRRCNEYGKKATIDIATEISKNNIPIVSGLAKGIDGYSHTIALKNNCYTIAVIGTGIDICYPKEHISLMNEICNNGLVISQFPPGISNVRQNFIKRNELIAMLSEKIIVVQAGKNSGALYTSEVGMKYKKEVFAVPNSIYDSFSVGTNSLISKGAKPYINIRSIIENAKLDNRNNKSSNMNNEKNKLYNIVKNTPCTLDIIKRRLNMDDNELEELLLEMEIEGQIKQVGGVFLA